MDGIINYLNQIDTNIFLYFNGLHNHYWDYFMTMYSDRFVWIPFYASFLYVMLRNFHIKETVTCLLVIVAIIFICDQTASTLLKPMIGRMRPSNPDNPISSLLMSYSRIYLGVHYPGDLFVGMLIGLITATASYYVFRYFARNYTDKFKPGGMQLKYQRYPIYTGLISIWVMLTVSGILAYIN